MDLSPAQYKLLPLPHPSKQIRLLYLHGDSKTDIVRCETSIWTLNNAPSFRAISYTWGAPELQAEISVDGKHWIVRHNCAYALWQARHHFPGSYVWIDSVCINQQDLLEKSAQVNVMGDVYAKSAEVLACIGAPDESSDYVYDILPRMDEILHDVPDGWYQGECRDYEWFPSATSSQAAIVELLEHANKLSQRPYFSRVWIVQELFGGLGRTTVLCGTRSCDVDALLDLHVRLDACFNIFEDGTQHEWSQVIGDIHTLLLAYDNQDFAFPEILDSLGFCDDPRDRVYGILRLIDWDRFNVPRPVPDYTITRLQLALQVVERVQQSEISLASTIARALEVDLREIFVVSSRTTGQIDTSCRETCIQRYRSWTSGIYGSSRIYVDDTQRMSVDLLSREDFVGSTMLQDILDGIELRARNSGPCPFVGGSPLQLYTKDTVSVLACQQTSPGDILVAAPYAGVFVLRPTRDVASYEMVGRAIIVNAHTIPRAPWNCDCWSDLGHRNCEVQDIRLAFELSDIEALIIGAASFGNHQRNPGEALDYASLEVPQTRSIVRDVTASNWIDHLSQRSSQTTCRVHGIVEYA